MRLETSYRGNGLGGTQFLRTGGFPGVDHRQRGRGFGDVLGQVFSRDYPTWSLGSDGELSARAQLRRGRAWRAPRSSAGRRRSESRACSCRPPRRSARPRGRCAARPSASTRRAPARRWRSSASTPSSGGTRSGLSTSFLVTQAQRDLAAGASESAAGDARSPVVARQLRGAAAGTSRLSGRRDDRTRLAPADARAAADACAARDLVQSRATERAVVP